MSGTLENYIKTSSPFKSTNQNKKSGEDVDLHRIGRRQWQQGHVADVVYDRGESMSASEAGDTQDIRAMLKPTPAKPAKKGWRPLYPDSDIEVVIPLYTKKWSPRKPSLLNAATPNNGKNKTSKLPLPSDDESDINIVTKKHRTQQSSPNKRAPAKRKAQEADVSRDDDNSHFVKSVPKKTANKASKQRKRISLPNLRLLEEPFTISEEDSQPDDDAKASQKKERAALESDSDDLPDDGEHIIQTVQTKKEKAKANAKSTQKNKEKPRSNAKTSKSNVLEMLNNSQKSKDAGMEGKSRSKLAKKSKLFTDADSKASRNLLFHAVVPRNSTRPTVTSASTFSSKKQIGKSTKPIEIIDIGSSDDSSGDASSDIPFTSNKPASKVSPEKVSKQSSPIKKAAGSAKGKEKATSSEEEERAASVLPKSNKKDPKSTRLFFSDDDDSDNAPNLAAREQVLIFDSSPRVAKSPKRKVKKVVKRKRRASQDLSVGTSESEGVDLSDKELYEQRLRSQNNSSPKKDKLAGLKHARDKKARKSERNKQLRLGVVMSSDDEDNNGQDRPQYLENVERVETASSTRSEEMEREERDFIEDDETNMDMVREMLPQEFSGHNAQPLYNSFQNLIYFYVYKILLPVTDWETDVNAFKIAIHKVRQHIGDQVNSLVRSQAWKEKFNKALELPLMYMKSIIASEGCDACQLPGRKSTKVASFSGRLYNPKTLGFLQHGSSDSDQSTDEDEDQDGIQVKTFRLGRQCAERVEHFHALRHFMYDLYHRTVAEVNRHRMFDPSTPPVDQKMYDKWYKEKKQEIDVVLDKLASIQYTEKQYSRYTALSDAARLTYANAR